MIRYLRKIIISQVTYVCRQGTNGECVMGKWKMRLSLGFLNRATSKRIEMLKNNPNACKSCAVIGPLSLPPSFTRSLLSLLLSLSLWEHHMFGRAIKIKNIISCINSKRSRAIKMFAQHVYYYCVYFLFFFCFFLFTLLCSLFAPSCCTHTHTQLHTCNCSMQMWFACPHGVQGIALPQGSA